MVGLKKDDMKLLKKVVAVIIIMLIAHKLYLITNYKNAIYLQSNKNNSLIIKVNNSKKDISLDENSELAPKVLFFDKSMNTEVNINNLTSNNKQELSFNSYLYQWILIDISNDSIKITKYIYPPIFQ